MGQRYEIDQIIVGDSVLHVLKKAGADSFLTNLATNPKKKHDAELILKHLKRIGQLGFDWAFKSETLKRLNSNGSPPIHELRCMPRTTRVMMYLHNSPNGMIPVLLFDFEGHKAGKSRGGISEDTLKRGHKLAGIARELMREREGVRDGGPELGAGRADDNGRGA